MSKRKKKKAKKSQDSYLVIKVENQITRQLPVLKDGTDESYFNYAEEKSKNYTYAFHQLYKRTDESEDPGFIKETREKSSMCDIEYRSCKTEAAALRESELALDEIRQEKIDDLTIMYSDPDTTSGQRYNILNKIASLNGQIGHNAVFGGIALMRNLTKSWNTVHKAEKKMPEIKKQIELLDKELEDAKNKGLSEKETKEIKEKLCAKKRELNSLKTKKSKAYKRIPKLKNELKEKRMMDTFLMGEANQKGNRFVDFDLDNSLITLKITGDKKYKVHIKIPKKFLDELKKVQELIEKKQISVSVHFSKKYIKLHYEKAIVSGYAIDECQRRKEVKEIKNESYPKDVEEEKVKEVYRNYYAKQRQAMLVGKIDGRCIAIDLNPGDIGYSVLQKNESKDGYKIIAAGRLSWHSLMHKTGSKSSSARAKRYNNKRKYAVCLALKLLFEVAAHYQCAEFIMENLDFDDTINNKTKESNRKCKNIWHRELTEKIINRRCVENGIYLVKVNACYTSWMGNIKHHFCDSTNASVEIGRRGLLRYTNDSFFPIMSSEDLDTMSSVIKDGDKVAGQARDAQGFTTADRSEKTWKEFYQTARACYKNKADFEHRYRRSTNDIGIRPYV